MMKRPMLQASVAYCSGIVLACLIHHIFIILLIVPATIFLFLYGRKRKVVFSTSFLLCGTFISFGFVNYAYQYTLLSEPLIPYYENNVTITGYISDAYKVKNGRITFEFHIEKINHSEENTGRKILVNVYNVKNAADYSLGTGLILNGVLKNPPGSRNPGGFDYRNYLYTRRIAAIISLNENMVEKTGFVKKLPLKRFGLELREYIVNSLERNLSGEKAALIAAMLTGYRENLTETMENAFSASGLTHIMAVSGANLAFLIFPLLWIFSMVGLDRRTGSVMAIPFIFLYLLITGMEASVLRASVMAMLLLLGRALYRKVELVNSVAIAVLVLLAINPFMFFDVGFQLSVGATLGLGILYKRIEKIFPDKIPGIITETLSATMSAQAGVLPVLIMHFNKVSLISLLSNLLVVPVTGFATTFGAVCVVLHAVHPLLGKATGYVLEAVSHLILYVTDKCASVPWAEIYLPDWSYGAVFLYYVLIFLWGIYGINFFRKNKSAVIACAFVTGIVLLIQGIIPKPLKVIFTDVGQGDCIFIRTPEGRNFLIDGGGTYNEDETGYHGKRIILPMLMHEKVSHIDMALVTHAHSDHMGGILTLIEVFNVKSVGLPAYPDAETDFVRLINLCKDRNIPVYFFGEGDIIGFDNYTVFEVLNPPSSEIDIYGNLNNTSICGMLRFKDLSILFTGDIETEAERLLLKYGDHIDCDILKVAHHGGKESTTREFLDLAKPEVAVISAGSNNYGHPSDEVIERLSLKEARIYITKESGAVIVLSNGKNYRLKPWVKERKYTFWPD
ncbi:competence protein ComE [Thermoclostridium stercorarium subsp. thermolacticum DSM 2910]|uniref:Competence protein ComE n=2 Tax=Thermoclostridium stercorarium TaxID=1510 RepID=A0A1B1YMG8_THEST|nr:DNA internalization-related competence protein ComEC/Rec2 [Thermoclostridium stercorarium]ANW99352.1 competence protein ComE [Thermoclostridium stercorarium subsp. thermolacticum DSM 2910]ANX01980.1 competence protein ComE [Thermoclostridium stercorarium subsp. leptospartum DSM 9219]